jgi:dihydrodipicolinate synthase/N-acetylneuraminate lyase
MDAFLSQLAAALLSHGLPGVIIAGMAVWIWKIQDKLNAVQEKRVQDAMKIAEAAHTFAGALDRNTEAMRAFAED